MKGDYHTIVLGAHVVINMYLISYTCWGKASVAEKVPVAAMAVCTAASGFQDPYIKILTPL